MHGLAVGYTFRRWSTQLQQSGLFAVAVNMVAESPAKFKPKLPQSTPGAGYLPMAMPRQREPYLYPFKLPLVVLTLTSLATVALSPWPCYQKGLWLLVFFSSCSLFSVLGQAIRMITVVRRYRDLYVNGSSSSISTGSSKDINTGSQHSIAGAKVVVVEVPARPGHKKALRSKGHRSTVSLDATDGCDQFSESVALVVDCEDWSDSTSSSGTDWQAGPPRWNHVFVIPNYKEVSLLCVVGWSFSSGANVSRAWLAALCWRPSCWLGHSVCARSVCMIQQPTGVGAAGNGL